MAKGYQINQMRPLAQVEYRLAEEVPFVLSTVVGAKIMNWRSKKSFGCVDRLECRGDVLDAIGLYEAMKAPSMRMDVLEPDDVSLFEKARESLSTENGPRRFPRRAMRGRLYGWKLFAAHFFAKGEIWLSFVNEQTGRIENLQLGMTNTPVYPVNKARIVMSDGRYYDYQYNRIMDEMRIEEYTTEDVLVRIIMIRPNGKIFVEEKIQ